MAYKDYELGSDNESELSKSIKYQELLRELPFDYPVSIYDFGSGEGMFEKFLLSFGNVKVSEVFMYDVRYDTDKELYEKASKSSIGYNRTLSSQKPDKIFDIGIVSGVLQDCDSIKEALQLLSDVLSVSMKLLLCFRYNTSMVGSTHLMVPPSCIVEYLIEQGHYEIKIRRVSNRHLYDNYILVATPLYTPDIDGNLNDN